MVSCLLLLLGRFSYIARMGKRGAVICLVSSCLLEGGGGVFQGKWGGGIRSDCLFLCSGVRDNIAG